MARLARLALGGHLHLLQQRAHAAGPVFLRDEDFRLYLDALRVAAHEYGVAIHAYALLPDRVLLLATPATDDALGRMLQALGRRFGAQINRQRNRSGTLWDGRFRGALVDAQQHLLDCMRFVEEAPVVAGLASDALEYPWSTAAHHAGLRADPLVQEHELYWRLGNTPFERQDRHRRLLADSLPDATRRAIENAAQRSWAIGSEAFLSTVATTTTRPLKPRKKGRPPREVVRKTVPVS